MERPVPAGLRRGLLPRALACVAALVFVCAAASYGQSAEVTLHVDFTPALKNGQSGPVAPLSVAWLAPASGEAASTPEPRTFRMIQKDKRFDPHLLVVPVGSLVQFPNRDPFFHNVFSFYNGKRFDLGLYETGSERGVRFDREGVSYIFCNIHPEMGAVILALATPYYAVSREGAISIQHVPPGRYTLNVWSEGATTESLNAARRPVTVTAEGVSLGSVALKAAPSPLAHHANKFGQSYPPAGPPDGSPY